KVTRLIWTGLLAHCPLLAVSAEDPPSPAPDVTIRTDRDKTIQEYRQTGFLYAVKITPNHGKPYFQVRADRTSHNFIL
ncbi:DUF2782 domain-containing protein, partial [Pseudomonas syringae group genomosp. 7]|uniref:DUF2782 domain-containing protein n=1 Tax=Pseudomonas syringae group genomosp. 7 TaxID=251699 RepID=UPI0037706291